MAEIKSKTVIFDLDGTLIDGSGRHYAVYRDGVADFGGVALDKKTYWDLKRKKTRWPELLKASQLDPKVEEAFLEVFIPRIEDPHYLAMDTLFPGALRVLEYFKKRATLYLMSLRRNEDNLVNQLVNLGIEPYFDRVLCGHSETNGYDKKIALIASLLIPKNHGVIIGDTEADIIAGQKTGLCTVAVTSGVRDEMSLIALQPDYLVSKIADVLRLPIAEEV